MNPHRSCFQTWLLTPTSHYKELTHIYSLGPRKMLRLISAAADLSTPTTFRDHALHDKPGYQTPLANVREGGHNAASGTGYFPAQPEQGPNVEDTHETKPELLRSSTVVPIRQSPTNPDHSSSEGRRNSVISPVVMTPSVLAEQGNAPNGSNSDNNTTVLLVEDNEVNMKVSPMYRNYLHTSEKH